MKRHLLDVSVVLDLLLNRDPWAKDAACIWDAHRTGQIGALLAAFAVPTIFYIVQRQAGKTAGYAAIQACLATLEIIPTDRTTLLAAQALPGLDFEDNLQIASAVNAGADGIVTRDPGGFAGSPIPVLTPADLVASLAGPNTP